MAWPFAAPAGGTAVRPHWLDLPAEVRAAVLCALGTEVRTAHSQGSGFTPGFASVLDLTDGRRVFVKGASPRFGWLRDAYAREAAMLATLPDGIPAPRIRQQLDVVTADGTWLVLVFDAVTGRPPQRPWRPDQAARVVAAVEELAELLTPAPPAAGLTSAADEFATAGPSWLTAAVDGPWARHADEIGELLAARHELLSGDTLVHFDLRDDNLIVADDGRIWVCDWNFPVSGPVWTDLVCILISMYGDGLDADATLRASRLVGPGDADGIDCLLAFLTGYFVHSGRQGEVPNSPWLRTHQRWYAEVTGDWLRRRRGWLAD